MRELNFIKTGKLDWIERDEPELMSADDAIVRPIVVSGGGFSPGRHPRYGWRRRWRIRWCRWCRPARTDSCGPRMPAAERTFPKYFPEGVHGDP